MEGRLEYGRALRGRLERGKLFVVTLFDAYAVLPAAL